MLVDVTGNVPSLKAAPSDIRRARTIHGNGIDVGQNATGFIKVCGVIQGARAAELAHKSDHAIQL